MCQLRWTRAGDMEDKIKYLTIYQSLAVVVLCIGLLIAINTTGDARHGTGDQSRETRGQGTMLGLGMEPSRSGCSTHVMHTC